MRVGSLEGKLAALLATTVVVTAAVAAPLTHWLGDATAGGLLAVGLLALPVLWMARRTVRPVARLLRALSDGVVSYREGDFSLSLASARRDELGALVAAHNALGQALRDQRAQLVERELLLDTVVQHTPTSLVLTDPNGRVVLANLAARRLLNDGRNPLGQDFEALISRCPEPMRRALETGEEGLFSTEMEGTEEYFHLAQRAFRLRGRPHRLYLMRRLTRELSRQEVATWKRVIRVISHELNNSLAPISSLARSGAELARRQTYERLPSVFATIGERAHHLHEFIDGYATFAKLPAPRGAWVEWGPFLERLAGNCRFTSNEPPPDAPGWFDAVQLEQVLLNLVKNAHESGSPAESVTLSVIAIGPESRIEVADRGPGMSETVLAQALLPFYSTKRGGTGLGLTLCREIVEAHGGRLTLANREEGGLRITVHLPGPPGGVRAPGALRAVASSSGS